MPRLPLIFSGKAGSDSRPIYQTNSVISLWRICKITMDGFFRWIYDLFCVLIYLKVLATVGNYLK